MISEFVKPIYFFILCGVLSVTGCATKYIIPGNRFITPETQGGVLKGQFEFQQTSATQLSADLGSGGVLYSDTSRSGFLFSNSFFEQFDLVWSHTGSANSLIGGKFQFLGASKTGNATGHKMSLVALVGGNEHETDDAAVEFELSGKEFLLLYGYRITQNILPYTSFSYATYDFSGKVSSSDASINGLELSYISKIKSLSGGVEFNLQAFFAKLEATYQQLETESSKDRERLMFGYSVGFSW